MKWAYIIDGSESTYISDSKCRFLESEITEVNTKTNEQEIGGVDGVLVGSNTFDSFELTLKFYYNGVDNSDLMLFTEKIKKIIHTRSIMYVIHSDMPGRKYAFNSAKIEWEKITNSDMTFSIIFNCFKGYSESIYDTSHIRNNDNTWQFGSGMEFNDDSLIYKHTTSGFKIFNGSDDKIDPLLNHKLIIYINIDAPNGFILWNRTTDEQFIYRKPVESSQAFTIKGVHPLLDGQRVGHNSNWQWITLEKGYNDFQFLGDGISNINVEFVFNYIYR